MNLYAVIPSGFRVVELRNLVTRLVADGVYVVVVDTGYAHATIAHERVHVLQDHALPKNIQRWWNLGLQHVYDIWHRVHTLHDPGQEFVVAVLNDDLIVPRMFVQKLAAAIEDTGAAAASPCLGLRTPVLRVEGFETHYRMLGYAFALRGSLGLLADEAFGWWYGDNDLDWQARQHGGMTLVGGAWEGFSHLYPDRTTVGELAAQAQLDRQTFVDKWGRAPW